MYSLNLFKGRYWDNIFLYFNSQEEQWHQWKVSNCYEILFNKYYLIEFNIYTRYFVVI